MSNNAAIVVGVDEYGNPEFCLDSCVSDALTFASWAVSNIGGGVDPNRLKLLLSPRPSSQKTDGFADIPGTRSQVPYQQATRDNIITAVDDFRTSAQPSDHFYFYFAGHGSSAPGMVSAARGEPVLISTNIPKTRINN